MEGIETKDIKEESYIGLSDAEIWTPGQPLSVSTGKVRYPIYAVNGWIQKGTAYDREMKQFSRHKKMTELSGQIGTVIGIYRQRYAIGKLLQGSTINWNATEGLPWFHKRHPLDPDTAGVNAYWGNLVTGGPSIETLLEAETLMIGTRDDNGRQSDYAPSFLLCSTNRWPIWDRIIGTPAGDSDNANHSKNLFTGKGKYKVHAIPCRWIPPEFDNMAFLFAQKHGSVWNNVIDLETSMYYDKQTQNTYHWGVSCFTSYIRDWRGVVMISG
jgi:hypothetical protein